MDSSAPPPNTSLDWQNGAKDLLIYAVAAIIIVALMLPLFVDYIKRYHEARELAVEMREVILETSLYLRITRRHTMLVRATHSEVLPDRWLLDLVVMAYIKDPLWDQNKEQ